ncbi:hypothetical protein BX616_009800 [Lobosporangium transversale]|nr:hypothetical protein BX616_009800 [Lobosporangium transversale]
MSSSNNTASPPTSKVAGKKRAPFHYVPWERPIREVSKIKKLFLESELCNFVARTESALYQDGDEVRPRKYLFLEGGRQLDLSRKPMKRNDFDIFWVHEPSLFKQLRRPTETEVMTEASSSRQESTLEMSERQLQKVLKELEAVDIDSPRSKLLQEKATLFSPVELHYSFTSGENSFEHDDRDPAFIQADRHALWRERGDPRYRDRSPSLEIGGSIPPKSSIGTLLGVRKRSEDDDGESERAQHHQRRKVLEDVDMMVIDIINLYKMVREQGEIIADLTKQVEDLQKQVGRSRKYNLRPTPSRNSNRKGKK